MAEVSTLLDASLPHHVDMSYFQPPSPKRKMSSPAKQSPLRVKALKQQLFLPPQDQTQDMSSQFGTLNLKNMHGNDCSLIANEGSSFLADTTILSESIRQPSKGRNDRKLNAVGQEVNENTPPARQRKVLPQTQQNIVRLTKG